jgi:hypothetical protein
MVNPTRAMPLFVLALLSAGAVAMWPGGPPHGSPARAADLPVVECWLDGPTTPVLGLEPDWERIAATAIAVV